MKNLFKILLGLFFVVPSFAQKGFPVKQDATYFNGITDSFNASLRGSNIPINSFSLEDRFKIEGMQLDGSNVTYPSNYLFDGTQTPENNGGSAGTKAAPVSVPGNYGAEVTRAYLIIHQNLSSSADVYAAYFHSSENKGFKGIVGVNGYSSDEKILIYPRNTFSQLKLFGLVRPITAGNKVVLTASYIAYSIAADFNFNAKKVIYYIGDSITRAGSINNSSATCNDVYSFALKNWFRTSRNINGINYPAVDCRIVDKSEGGRTSSDYERYRVNGSLDIPQADFIWIALGTNDTDPVAYSANVTALIKWALLKHPSVKIVLHGPIPKQGSEAAMDLIRAAGQAVVTSINNPNVIFINGKNAFDVNDYSNYSGTETNGNGVHPGVLGYTRMTEYYKSQLSNYPSFLTF